MSFEPHYVRDVDLHGFLEGLCNKGGPYGDCVRVYVADEVDAQWLARSKVPVHVDPTGSTREPPHCPTCSCGSP